MRFMFRKKRYNSKVSINDLQKKYEKDGEYRYAVVLLSNNRPIWCCKEYQDAREKVAEECVWSSRRCKIIDLCNM